MRLFNVGKQFRDNSGRPLSSGSVTFYDPKTLLEATVYSDGSEETETDNPITLGSDGRLPNDVWSSEPLRMVVKDKHGALVDDRDNVIDVFSSPYRGSWEPVLSAGDHQGTLSSYSASYIQLGALLFFNLSLTLSSKGSISGGSTVKIALPKRMDPGMNEYSFFAGAPVTIGPCSGLSITATVPLTGIVANGDQNESYIVPLEWDSTTGYSILSGSNVTDTTSITASGFYTVDT